MKKLHLICNSHIDPVWMWDFPEGIGTALSTFRQAAAFADEFDYIFCHNEAFLYEKIEKYDPTLFEKIKKLVKEGKWRIMGGWYIQPDCNIPSGEAFVRQIKLGRKYFLEKFGEYPRTAINFDSFGHTVGLVQILKKCGFDSYLICRPMPELLPLPANEIWWCGKDGSRVKVTRTPGEGLYCTGFGNALNEIKKKAEACGDVPVGIVLWGVGNHGGVPSRKDLCDVEAFIESEEDTEVLHSYPELYFEDIEPTHEFHRSLHPCLIGAYSSMSRIKAKHAELENRLMYVEKLCTLAELRGVYRRRSESFTEAERALALLEFHDIGSGTCTDEGERSALRKSDYALELLEKEWEGAFFNLTEKHKKAGEGEFPHFIFNSQPYEREAEVEMEYLMPKALISNTEQYTVTVRQNGKVIPSQCIKERSNINYDRRKRIAVRCTLPAFDIARFDITVEVTPKVARNEEKVGDIILSDSKKTVRISRKTGLIESYIAGGKELLSGGAFQPVMYKDNADPWGWYMDSIGKEPEPFRLSDCKRGPFSGLESVKVTEDGDVLTEVDALFEGGASFVRMTYCIYKELPYIDVRAEVLFAQKERALKLRVPTSKELGEFSGQVPFSTESFEKDGNEITAQRFVSLADGENSLAIFNDAVYSHSHDGDAYYATLLRGAAYCAHPLDGIPLIKEPERYIPYIENGKHTFSFRLAYAPTESLESLAQEFLAKEVEAINLFPSGRGADTLASVKISDGNIALISACEGDGGLELRLLNNFKSAKSAELSILDRRFKIDIGAFEAKTYVYDGEQLKEKTVWF